MIERNNALYILGQAKERLENESRRYSGSKLCDVLRNQSLLVDVIEATFDPRGLPRRAN